MRRLMDAPGQDIRRRASAISARAPVRARQASARLLRGGLRLQRPPLLLSSGKLITRGVPVKADEIEALMRA